MNEVTDVSHGHGEKLFVGVVSHELKTSPSIEAKAGASGFGAVRTLAEIPVLAKQAGMLPCTTHDLCHQDAG